MLGIIPCFILSSAGFKKKNAFKKTTKVSSVTARHTYPSLALVQPRKTFPYLTERFLKSNKQIKVSNSLDQDQSGCFVEPITGSKLFEKAIIR